VRRHNAVSVATAQIRLRLAMHAGVVQFDGEGLIGTAVNHAARLLDAEQLKEMQRHTGADVVQIASQRMYDDVIRHGLGLVDPGEYQPVLVRVKETATPAWVRVPGAWTAQAARPPAPVTVIDARGIPPAESTFPDPPPLAPAITVIDRAPDLDALVDLVLAIRQLRGRHLRDQIIAELPLALARVLKTRRRDEDRADMSAIIRACHEHRNGLHELLRVIRQFVGDSAQVDELSRTIDAVEQV
jgi:hypothetical protein